MRCRLSRANLIKASGSDHVHATQAFRVFGLDELEPGLSMRGKACFENKFIIGYRRYKRICSEEKDERKTTCELYDSFHWMMNAKIRITFAKIAIREKRRINPVSIGLQKWITILLRLSISNIFYLFNYLLVTLTNIYLFIYLYDAFCSLRERKIRWTTLGIGTYGGVASIWLNNSVVVRKVIQVKYKIETLNKKVCKKVNKGDTCRRPRHYQTTLGTSPPRTTSENRSAQHGMRDIKGC